MRLRSTLLAATLLAAPVAVKAQPVTGLYIGAGGGVNFITDEYERRSLSAGTVGKTLSFKPGWVGQGAIGYGLGNGLRLEIEGNGGINNLRRSSGTAFPTSSGGEQQNFGGFVNALYDFSLGLPVVPYVGVGVGYEDTRWNHLGYYSVNRTPAVSATSTGYYGSLGYQAKLGFAVPLAGIPGLALTAEYRFMGVLPNEHFGLRVTSGGTTSVGRAIITSDYNHAAIFGIRYAFGAAAPVIPGVTPVAPAPTPARTYLVFFDWDKSNLTDRARQIIAEAAQASTHVTYTRIEVNGYTDLSGTAQYNQGLSVRRAQSVAAELVRDGVPKTAIAIRGFGETNPLVPTAKGVREPQNRRVEIIIR